jgi:hypothetical protein
LKELANWLGGIRREAGLSLGDLADKTKIAPRHLEALEAGDLAAFPTSVHARAFALAFARACGADEEEALAQVNAAFARKAAVAAPAKNGKAPRPEAEAPPAAAEESAPALPAEGEPLPWKLWSLVAAGALAFLLILNWAVSCARGRASAPPAAAPAASQPEPVSATAESAPPQELSLRSRRPCWVLLVIDGKRLPVVFLEPNKRERWMVKDSAVMLEGNSGAVRVWWRGEDLGYFGALGERVNGLVFENGKPWRKDAGADLALPSGVPSKASP